MDTNLKGPQVYIVIKGLMYFDNESEDNIEQFNSNILNSDDRDFCISWLIFINIKEITKSMNLINLKSFVTESVFGETESLNLSINNTMHNMRNLYF